jgi:putative ABC transport system ATP-binding protein
MDIFGNLAHNEGFCVIIATHDMEIAGRADEILHLKDGVLMQA